MGTQEGIGVVISCHTPCGKVAFGIPTQECHRSEVLPLCQSLTEEMGDGAVEGKRESLDTGIFCNV